MGTTLRCDFCLSPHVVYGYPCPDIEVAPVPFVSVGSWAACAPCHDLIEANDIDGLVARADAPVPPEILHALYRVFLDFHRPARPAAELDR